MTCPACTARSLFSARPCLLHITWVTLVAVHQEKQSPDLLSELGCQLLPHGLDLSLRLLLALALLPHELNIFDLLLQLFRGLFVGVECFEDVHLAEHLLFVGVCVDGVLFLEEGNAGCVFIHPR